MKIRNIFNMAANILFFLAVTEIVLRYKYFLKKEKVSFRAQVVLITGGTRGLGLELARCFASEGAKIAIIARNEFEFQSVEEQIRNLGAEFLALKCDISNDEQVKLTVNEIVKRFGTIDVLVNNAGIIQVGPFQNMKREDFQNAMNVNAWGTFNVTMAVIPHMELKRNGRIVNITSLGGVVAVPHLLPYVFSKFAMVGFSEGLQSEIEKTGIKVTTVIPGLMRTGSPVNALFKGNYRSEFRWFSFLDSFPLISIDSKKAASKIVDSCRRGAPVLVITLPAHVAMVFKALFPFISAKIIALSCFFLPDTTGRKGDMSMPGYVSKQD